MNKQPLLIINVELNLGYRPQLIIYKDTSIDYLIEQFVLQHDLKPTAILIIKQLVLDNLKGKTTGKSNQKNYTDWKSNHLRQKSKQNNRLNKQKPLKKQPPRQSLLQMSFQQNNNGSGNNTARNSNLKTPKEQQKKIQLHHHSGQVQKQFQRQFKRIKLQRVAIKQEQTLKLIYRKLTQLNPEGLYDISPEYIDFSGFSADFLTILQQFFEVLKEEDFVQLDFVKFKSLIEKYHYRDLFKIQKKFS